MEVTMNKRVVQITGFRGAEKDALIELLFKLDCVFVSSKKFENCTHLVARKPCKSEKWLAACATGKWVLTKDYIIKSAESGRWLDETTYEWGYKIEKDSHYSPQMQSAPKRWRENLTRTGALGAFSRWKVLLLFNKNHKEREAIIRVLKAGQAILRDPQDFDQEITHIFTSHTSFPADRPNKQHNVPYYSVQYIGTYLLEEPVTCTLEETPGYYSLEKVEEEEYVANMTDEQIDDIKRLLWKHICFAQALHHKYVKQDIIQKPCKMKTRETSQARLNRIEGLLEGHFLAEAFEELAQLLPSTPPVSFLQSLLNYLIQGTVNEIYFGRVFDMLYSLLQKHPPWESTYMVQYYLEFLQCPICKKGTWPFIEMLIRSCLENQFCLCHHLSDLQIEPCNRRAILSSLLKFVANVMQEEAKALSRRLCECTDFQHNTFPPSLIVKIFWSENRTPKLLTNIMCSLTDLVLRCHKEIHFKDNIYLQEEEYHMNKILGAAVDYFILLGFYLNTNLLRQVTNDLVLYITVACEDFSLKEREKLICSIASSWLQMLLADAFFQHLCIESKLNFSSEPLSLKKLICSYIPVFWRVGTRSNEKVQKLEGKRKIGQRPCLESQRALLMLNGENQNQDEVLLDLPVFAKLRRRADGGSVCIKENLPSIVQELPCNRQNSKGETALHRACINNKVRKLLVLLSLPGININAKDYVGWTPLHEACNHGSTECVREILQRCPEVDLLSHVHGVTPLHDALLNGHLEISKMLLQYGGPAILQHKDSDGRFPLDYVASPQLRKELFDIVQVNETIEDFHMQASQDLHHYNIEFNAFLLCRMFMSFCSLYAFPSSSIDAKILCLNADDLIKRVKAKQTASSFSNWFVECYIEDLATIQRNRDLLQSIPETVVLAGGFNVKLLLAILQTISTDSPASNRKEKHTF